MGKRTELAAVARAERDRRQWIARWLAADHGGVVTRRMLTKVGFSRGQIATQVERGLWVPAGTHTLCVEGAEPTGVGLWWWAVWESGTSAVLDGTSALLAGGLRNWSDPVVHVSVAHNTSVRKLVGVRHHRRREMGRLVSTGLPRTRPAVAVIRAAQWAGTDRQAATLIAMTVQQGLATPSAVLQEWSEVQRSPRRGFLNEVIGDVCDGAQSLGELDFARLCRVWGLPKPTRQVVRAGPNGRIYLDVFWEEWRVHVEVHGVHHYAADVIVNDALRTNHVGIQLRGLISLQIPLLGLRTRPEEFMKQVYNALMAQGWRGAA